MFYVIYPEFWKFSGRKLKYSGNDGQLGEITSYNIQSRKQIMTENIPRIWSERKKSANQYLNASITMQIASLCNKQTSKHANKANKECETRSTKRINFNISFR